MQLTEILDLVIQATPELKTKFENHKKNLSEANGDEVAILTDIISTCSKLCESPTPSPIFTQIKNEVIRFLKNEGNALCKQEINPPTIAAEKVSGINLTKDELVSLNQNSLLCRLFGAVPSDYSLEIINTVIAECDDLSQRPDLILIMIDQSTISSTPDMSETFDLLVRKNLPLPSLSQQEALLTSDRSSSGHNANKLALSFLNEKNELSLISNILNYNFNGSNDAIKQRVKGEKSELMKSLSSKVRDENNFAEVTKLVVRTNSDEWLSALLSNPNNPHIQRIENHCAILDFAIKNKLIRTFEILTNAGFDLLRHPTGQTNPFVIACETQGETALEPYLKAVEKRFGGKKVKEVLSDRDESGNALQHAINGRGYVNVVTLLEKYGANLRVDNLANLKLAAANNRAGAFDILLRGASDPEIEIYEYEISKWLGEMGRQTSYVTDCVMLDHLTIKDSPFAEKLKKRITEKKSSLTEDDLFSICEFNGGVTLKYFVKHMEMRGFNIEEHVNDFDHPETKRTPLYYAINNQAYDSLVTALLNYGANPDKIAPNLDAATLAIRNKEFGTLRLLLESEKLSARSIENAELERRAIGENALCDEAFFGGLSTEQLATLRGSTQLSLLKSALAKPESGYLDKFKRIAGNLKMDEIIDATIHTLDLANLGKLFDHFDVKNLVSRNPLEIALEVARKMEEEVKDKTVRLQKTKEAIEKIDGAIEAMEEERKVVELRKKAGFAKHADELVESINKKTKGENPPIETIRSVIKSLLLEGFKANQFSLENLGIRIPKDLEIDSYFTKLIEEQNLPKLQRLFSNFDVKDILSSQKEPLLPPPPPSIAEERTRLLTRNGATYQSIPNTETAPVGGRKIGGELEEKYLEIAVNIVKARQEKGWDTSDAMSVVNFLIERNFEARNQTLKSHLRDLGVTKYQKTFSEYFSDCLPCFR